MLKIAKKIKVATVIVSASLILLSSNVFAYTRQKTEIYGGYNIPVLTYVIAPSRHLTVFKKFRRKNIAVLTALKRLQTIIGKNDVLRKTAESITRPNGRLTKNRREKESVKKKF